MDACTYELGLCYAMGNEQPLQRYSISGRWVECNYHEAQQLIAAGRAADLRVAPPSDTQQQTER